MCEQVRTIQNGVVEAANAMAVVEVSAEPGERAIILADGLDAMIDVVRHAELPSAPVELVGGIRERREEVVRDADIEAAEFRMNWSLVEAEDRAAAVQFVFVVGEKLMSEVEPRITGDTPSELIEIARGVPACQFVIQLPRTAG